MRYPTLLAVLAMLVPGNAMAAEMRIDLDPGHGSVAIRAYGLGLLPLDGRFNRFQGVLRYDPADHAHCTVVLRVDVASLTMGTETVGEMVRGPDFLDVARFPTLVYDGACRAAGIAGQLTMHGVTRPFALMLEWGKGTIAAVARLRRADWGMTARPLLGGSTVRITVTAVSRQ